MPKDQFAKLKELLLSDEREQADKLSTEISKVKKELWAEDDIEHRVEPVIERKIEYLKENFPILFGDTITETIKLQIRESQDEVVDALYPILGKMVKKYVSSEFQRFSDNVDKQLTNVFSWKFWQRKFKSWFGGVKESDLLMQQIMDPQVMEIFVVEQESGILLGSYSRNKTMDQDMIAAMLTAIKSFVHDAFQKKDQELEIIEYETYKIFIKNFKSYYISVVLTGVIDEEFKNRLDDTVLDFAVKMRKSVKETGIKAQEGSFSDYLEESFEKFGK